jgi:ABC-2 type transport system permease protein
MIGSLIKKDFLLAKKAIIRALIIGLVIILVLVASDGRNDFQNKRFGLFIFLYLLILVMVTWMTQVAIGEEKNPHAAALLCAAPYSRKNFVVAKYICYLILFAECFVLYSIIAALQQELNLLNAAESLLGFLVGTICYGLYTNTAMKNGMAKASYILTAAILIMALGPLVLVKIFRLELVSFMLFMSDSSNAVLITVILGCVSVCIFLLFMRASIHNFEKKEL